MPSDKRSLRAISIQRHDTTAASAPPAPDAPARFLELEEVSLPAPPALEDAPPPVVSHSFLEVDEAPAALRPDALEMPEPAPAAPTTGPGLAEDSLTTARGFLLIDRYDMALPYFQQATQLAPNYADAWQEMGRCCAHLEQYAPAVDALMQATRLDPANTDTLNLLGQSCLALRRYRQAGLAFQLSLRLRPEQGETLLGLGVAHLHLEEYQAAFDALTQAVLHLPGDPRVVENLSLTCEKLGEQRRGE